MKTIGIIPARGGSKGIPRKNLALCCDKPLIQWTIEAARASKLDRVLVTSEDEEILAFATKMDIPTVRRPEALATDSAELADVVQHALWTHGGDYDHGVLLQPTSPLRTAEDINESLEIAHRSLGRCVSVYKSSAIPFSMEGGNRQWRRATLIQNGAIYVFPLDGWDRRFSLSGDNLVGRDLGFHWVHVMPRERSVDIDEPFDLEVADMLLRKRS